MMGPYWKERTLALVVALPATSAPLRQLGLNESSLPREYIGFFRFQDRDGTALSFGPDLATIAARVSAKTDSSPIYLRIPSSFELRSMEGWANNQGLESGIFRPNYPRHLRVATEDERAVFREFYEK